MFSDGSGGVLCLNRPISSVLHSAMSWQTQTQRSLTAVTLTAHTTETDTVQLTENMERRVTVLSDVCAAQCPSPL